MTIKSILETAYPFIFALLAGYIVYFLVRNVRLSGSTPVARIRGWGDDNETTKLDRYGDRVVDRLGLSLESWKAHLHWAQLGGHYPKWTTGGLFLRSVLYGLAGLFYVLLVNREALPFYIIPAVGAAMPFILVKGKADDVRKQTQRIAPEVVTVIAAEMGAGASPEAAVARASDIPGPLGLIIKRGLAESRRTERTLFSVGHSRGVLVEVMDQQKLPPLVRLGNQLDRVASKGSDAPAVMFSVARGFTRAYKTEAKKEAEGMDNKLLPLVAIFFFFPFLGGILLPMVIELFRTF